MFVRFVAEIREPWLRSTLEEGFPDWIAAIFVGFIGRDDDDIGRDDRDDRGHELDIALSELRCEAFN